jgi:hypothetical protein
LEGDDFAEGAAEVGFFEPEFVAEFGGLLFGRLVGVDGFDGDSEGCFELGFEREGFGEEKSGVDGEDGEGNPCGDGVMDGDKAGSLEAGADGGGGAVFVPGP